MASESMSDLDPFLALQEGLDEIEREIYNLGKYIIYVNKKKRKGKGIGMIISYLPMGRESRSPVYTLMIYNDMGINIYIMIWEYIFSTKIERFYISHFSYLYCSCRRNGKESILKQLATRTVRVRLS